MHSRFKLNLDYDFSSFYDKGKRLYDHNCASVKRSLDSFLEGGRLNGNQLQEHWFPQINADIFLSHSHKDEELAIGLAGWLKQEFNLDLFIDSCVWGYADDLLKQIDNKYCLNPEKDTYNYQKRNGSTSHIHMMLNVALSNMMDRTECLFFLNTPNSITSKEAITKTQSPWLFAEIAISEVIRHKAPKRQKILKWAKILEGEEFRAGLKIEYDINLCGMKEIKIETLKRWLVQFKKNEAEHPLDCLYQIKTNT